MPASAAINTPPDRIAQLIAKRPGRRALLRAVDEIGEAATSAELYEAVKCRHADIPRATFFRALRFLLENGVLRKAVLHGGECVYQRANDPRNILWVCDDCAKVSAFRSDEVSAALSQAARRRGMEASPVSVEVHFHCGCRWESVGERKEIRPG